MTVPDDFLPDHAFDEIRPRYGVRSLADLLPSVSAVLRVPGAVDVLGLTERLDGIDRIAVLLVDGLGAYQLPLAAEQAPVLADLGSEPSLTSGFPSTTPVSLVTLGTGVPPGAHGILGFTVRGPDGGVLNHIRWRDEPDPALWQPVPTRFEIAAAAGVAVTMVTRPEYRGSGLSVSANRGAAYVAAADPDATAEEMLAALHAAPGPALVYGYHPDLDHAGHVDGVNADSWHKASAEVGRLLQRLVEGLPPRTALLVTADHGQLNVPVEGRFDIAADPRLAAGLALVTGEPRVRYLHVEDGAGPDVVATWQGVLGDAAHVLTRDEALDAGYYGSMATAHRDRIGDVVVICRDRHVIISSGTEPIPVSRLIGYHGSVTAAEMTVPLLIAR